MQNTTELREPSATDGSKVWNLIKRAGQLDLNTPYCYLMLCDVFRTSCVVAEWNNELVGFVSALVKPEKPDTLFVWQIAVDPLHRGQGLGKSMLRDLLARSYYSPIRYIEATVSESNTASNRMFCSFAEEIGVVIQQVAGGYTTDMFPVQGHDQEPLIKLGPFKNNQQLASYY